MRKSVDANKERKTPVKTKEKNSMKLECTENEAGMHWNMISEVYGQSLNLKWANNLYELSENCRKLWRPFSPISFFQEPFTCYLNKYLLYLTETWCVCCLLCMLGDKPKFNWLHKYFLGDNNLFRQKRADFLVIFSSQEFRSINKYIQYN